MRRALTAIEGPALRDYRAFLRSEVRGKDVLDVGSVEHSADQASSDDWEFWVVGKVAKRLVGVDILPEEVVRLNAKYGLDIRVLDATSASSDLGESFDVVVAGDVIEHVTNLEGLVSFGVRHIRPHGKLIIKTPNPFFYPQVLDDWRSGGHVPNVDHTCWLSPPNMYALVQRIPSATLTRFCPHVPLASARLKERAKSTLLRLPVGRALAPDYVYEICRTGEGSPHTQPTGTDD